jgi:Fe-S cluster assembly iron-binding protein IscA
VYAANAATSPTLSGITVTEGGTSTGGVMFDLYDITGAATSPFDKAATAAGDQTSSGNLTTTTITPSTASGLVLNNTSIDFHTLNGIVGSGFVLDSDVNASDNDAAGTAGTLDSTLDEDNGFAHIYNATTSPITFVYTATATGTPSGVLDWGSVAAAFIAAPVGVGAPASPTALAVTLH